MNTKKSIKIKVSIIVIFLYYTFFPRWKQAKRKLLSTKFFSSEWIQI